MNRVQINDDIDLKITNKTQPDSISTAEDGANRKSMLDYVDQRILDLPVGVKTSSIYSLSATQQVLASDFNFCSFSGGKAYLPATNTIGKEIYVAASAVGIEIFGNQANTNGLFVDVSPSVVSIILGVNKMYRFTYVGIGGLWKVELLTSSSDLPKKSGAIQANANPPYLVLMNDFNTVTVNDVGSIVVLPSTIEIGKQVVVFAANNAINFDVQATQLGNLLLSTGGISSTTGSVSIAPNTSYRFIHINNGYWKVEVI